MSDPQPTTMLDALRSDHRAISAFLDDPSALDHTEEGAAIREQLVMNLVRHYVAEEQYLNPVIREHLTNGAKLADEGFERDRASEHQLRELEDPELSPDRLAAAWAAVVSSFAAHRDSQEATFAQLAKDCPAQVLAELGDEILGAEQLAPTRPRAVATESAAGSKLLSIVEGYVDHVRDYYSRRGVSEDDSD